MSRTHSFTGLLSCILLLVFIHTFHSSGWTKTMASNYFFEAPFSTKIQSLNKHKARIQATLTFDELYDGNVLAFTENIDQIPLKVFFSDQKIWLIVRTKIHPANQTMLDELMASICTKYSLPVPRRGRLTNRVTIPLENPDGTINIAGMLLPKSVVPAQLKIIARDEISKIWQIPGEQIKLILENGQVYWKCKKNGVQLQHKAMQRKSVSNQLPGKPAGGLIPFLFFVLPFAEIKLNRKEALKYMILLMVMGLSVFFPYIVHAATPHYAIVYPQNMSGWDSVISAAHTKYSHYTDFTFSNYISENLNALKSAEPDVVLIIAPPENFTPTFMDDADATLCQLDDDKFVDVTWAIISGYTANDALNLLNASPNIDSHALIIANPDGSLLTSGYAGNYLAQVQTDDDTHFGDADYFINDTGSANPNASAEKLSQEINADSKDCVWFLGHGNPGAWGLAQGHFTGSGSQLQTYHDGSFYAVNNAQNSLVDAEACLTLRIHDNRNSQWKPWENMSSNMTASASSSIALAWMEDSNGFYIGNTSVSYGNTHLMLTLLNMMKFGYSPAETIKFCKNIYQYIRDDETTDSDLTDGDGNDYLLYTARELAGLGAPDWTITLAGNPPDYDISYTGKVQQDLLTANDRGLVYTGQSSKWRCTTALNVNEEIYVEMDGAAEDQSPFTYIPVEDLYADTTGGYIGYSDVTAVIGGVFKPTQDTRQVDFVNTNPGDAEKLYSHSWYGAGDSGAVETFKCAKNGNEFIWLLAAGVTDADDDGTHEWRINQGYAKSFATDYWQPAVTQSVGSATKIDDKTWKRTVSVTNPGSESVGEIIVKTAVPNETQTLQLTPDTGTHDLVKISEGNETFAEFTISTLAAGETKQFELQYHLHSVSSRKTILGNGIPYVFLFESDTLAVITFTDRGSVDSLRVTAYPDSFPENCPGAPNQMPVKRFFELNPYEGTGYAAQVCLYYQQTEFENSDILDESALSAARWNGSEWQPQASTADPTRNRVCFETSTFSTWGIGGPNGSLPVELVNFNASGTTGKVQLSWSTASEFQNLGFEIYRSDDKPGTWQQTADFSTNRALRGAGTASKVNRYAFEDAAVEAGKTYWYQLKDVSFTGQKKAHPAISVRVEKVLPKEHLLSQNFPNPFNAVTHIRFAVGEGVPEQQVRLVIFDVTGRIVKNVVDQSYEPGWHTVKWDGKNKHGQPVASGMYFYQLEIGTFHSVKKLILMY